MALKVTKVDVWAVEIRDEPGGLAQVLSAMADAGSSLDCVIARREPDKFQAGVVFLTPVKGKKAEAAAGSVGLKRAEDLATLRVEGADKPGLGSKITGAIADAGINMRGLSAMTCGKNFVAYIGFDTGADADRAAAALKGVGRATAGRSASGRARGRKLARA